MEDLADTILAQKISQLSGVGLVSIAGGQKPAVRIQANPYGACRVMVCRLKTSVPRWAPANVDQAKGNLNGSRQAFTIGANDQLLSSFRLLEGDHRLSQRLAGAAVGRRQRG